MNEMKYDTMQSGRYLPIFRRSLLPPPSGYKSKHSGKWYGGTDNGARQSSNRTNRIKGTVKNTGSAV
jgi:hypothetical protein